MSKHKLEERTFSTRIVYKSGLPETLHHSIHSTLFTWKCVSAKEYIDRWMQNKIRREDKEMLFLYLKYKKEVESYITLLFRK